MPLRALDARLSHNERHFISNEEPGRSGDLYEQCRRAHGNQRRPSLEQLSDMRERKERRMGCAGTDGNPCRKAASRGQGFPGLGRRRSLLDARRLLRIESRQTARARPVAMTTRWLPEQRRRSSDGAPTGGSDAALPSTAAANGCRLRNRQTSAAAMRACLEGNWRADRKALCSALSHDLQAQMPRDVALHSRQGARLQYNLRSNLRSTTAPYVRPRETPRLCLGTLPAETPTRQEWHTGNSYEGLHMGLRRI